jgi:hypothetical protein
MWVPSVYFASLLAVTDEASRLFPSAYIFEQYIYSIMSIVSGFLALLVTVFVSFVVSFVSLARLDMRRLASDKLSAMFEPAFMSICAAMLVDHENNNPVKVVAEAIFCEQLLHIRKDDVRNINITSFS